MIGIAIINSIPKSTPVIIIIISNKNKNIEYYEK